ERKIAEELGQVLVDRAEAIRVARPPGYRQRVWADLRQAIALPLVEGGMGRVRSTLVACLGGPVGLDSGQDGKTIPRRTNADVPSNLSEWARKAARGGPVAVSPRGDVVATSGRDGQVAVYGPETKQLWHERSPLGAVYDMALTADGKLLVAGCEQGFV